MSFEDAAGIPIEAYNSAADWVNSWDASDPTNDPGDEIGGAIRAAAPFIAASALRRFATEMDPATSPRIFSQGESSGTVEGARELWADYLRVRADELEG